MITRFFRCLLSYPSARRIRESLARQRPPRPSIPESPQRILCIQMNAIGDTIMTQPAWTALRHRFAGAVIELACQDHIRPLIKADPSLNQVTGIHMPRSGSQKSDHNRELQKVVHAGHHDLIVDFSALGDVSAVVAANLKAFTAGFARYFKTPWSGFDLRSAYDIHAPYSETDHIRALDLRLVQSVCGMPIAGKPPKLFIQYDAVEKAMTLLRKWGVEEGGYIIVHPGAKWLPKRWPERYWKRLLTDLRDRFRPTILLLGAEEDRQFLKRIIASTGPAGILPIIGEAVDVAAALIKTAAVCICNDSAAMHIAAAVDTPLLALFGPVSPSRSAPPFDEKNIVFYSSMFCSPCTLYYSRSRCRRGINYCMYAIHPDEVIKRIGSIIDAGKTPL